MRALRIAFWTLVRTLCEAYAAWAWQRHQQALAMHTEPMRTHKRYVRAAKLAQRARLNLVGARIS